ncbi:M17 family peptidase N-terminal domain-containing protein [Flavobacterium psychrotrophum]|uniref:M17 family peptidase N-terminal domain-containing protein n=1 Tax=Flavobacterium psychrotrophum TaxID=2294119 RepID=UPI000E313AFC|nr:M17 family peptidase N-terminal domain-containing protein [Flavobacterium psychrotrophum]
MKNILSQLKTVHFSLVLALLLTTTLTAQTTAIGTSKVWGTIEGVAIEGLVQGPSTAKSDLQVACVFEYTEGDIYNTPPALPAQLNGLVHLDDALKGQLTALRKAGKFHGYALETVVLTPAKGTLAAPKLLIIGLGDRNAFTPELMKKVGSVAVREALRLGVENFSFASDLKDAGIDSPTAKVAGYVTEGIFDAYRSELWFKENKLSTFKPLKKVILLAGPAFFEVAGQGINEAISNLKN